MSHPLDGILVADFSRVLAGPLATTTLADLGATVVKVERPDLGDDTRTWGPPWTGRSSSYFECANRSKYSIELDMKDPADAALAGELAGRADVMVENFRTGTLASYGLDYQSVARTNPGIIYCSITGFGSGEGAARPGYDFLAQAVGGLMSITGEAGGDPLKVGVAVVDVMTGKDAVVGILAALVERRRSGRGDHIEVNLLSSLLGGLVNQTAAYLTTGTAPGRMGNRHPSISPYETLRCADGFVAVACGNDGQFRRLVAALGMAELADDERFATNPQRVANREALVPLLEQALSRAPARVWEEKLTAADVPAGPVNDIGGGLARAEELGLDPLLHFGDGTPPQVRHPVIYRSATTTSPAPPPGLGEHNGLIRSWLAGDRDRPLPHRSQAG